MADKRTGTCLCGKTSITTTNPLEKITACHCDMCRKWSGGPNLEFELETDVTLGGEDHIGIYKSSEWAERAFCKCCGTLLFYRLAEDGRYFVSIGIFGDDINPEFEKQVFIDKKPAYYSFDEKTTDYTEQQIFEMFGGD